jgi:hypothetical protein
VFVQYRGPFGIARVRLDQQRNGLLESNCLRSGLRKLAARSNDRFLRSSDRSFGRTQTLACCTATDLVISRTAAFEALYESPEISGHECAFDVRPPSSASYRGGRAGAQLTAQSERIRSWLVANRFQAISQASMMSVRLTNTELASQWLRR